VNAIQTVAYEVLRDQQPQVIFEFEIETSVSLYNVDWRLGDRITARYLDYQEDLRINSVEISLSANNEVIKPSFQKEIL
jgi:fibronectin type 3 domain-containing protein